MNLYPQPDAERQKLATKYDEIQRRLTLLEWLIYGILLFILVFSGFASEISGFFSLLQPWMAALYFILLGLLFGLVTLPISYYGGYVLPRRYLLSTVNLRTWLADRAKMGGLGLILGLVIVIFVYWTLGAFPDTWWVWCSILLLVISLLLTRFTPTLLISLFFRLESLQNEELVKRLRDLAAKSHTNLKGVFSINLSSKATTANAMLAGWGSTRRIILTDTLLQQYTHEEIEVILAHELAHHIMRHIPNLVLLQAIVTLLTFYVVHLALIYGMVPMGFKSMDDASAFPYITLVISIFGLIMMPILNAYSRQLETAADSTALELTGNATAFISAMTRLTDQNLSVAQPKRWVELLFYDHPPYVKRIEMAQHYLESHKQEENH